MLFRSEKFTALLHHVTVDLLRESFLALKRRAAPGVDGVTWEDYGVGLAPLLSRLAVRPSTTKPMPNWFALRSDSVNLDALSATTRLAPSGLPGLTGKLGTSYGGFPLQRFAASAALGVPAH